MIALVRVEEADDVIEPREGQERTVMATVTSRSGETFIQTWREVWRRATWFRGLAQQSGQWVLVSDVVSMTPETFAKAVQSWG